MDGQNEGVQREGGVGQITPAIFPPFLIPFPAPFILNQIFPVEQTIAGL